MITTIAGFREFIVFGVEKDDKKKIEHSQKEEIAKWMFWGLTVLLSFVSYFAELRPLVTHSSGPYYSGMLDGIVVTIVVLSIVFYLASKVEKRVRVTDSGIARAFMINEKRRVVGYLRFRNSCIPSIVVWYVNPCSSSAVASFAVVAPTTSHSSSFRLSKCI